MPFLLTLLTGRWSVFNVTPSIRPLYVDFKFCGTGGQKILLDPVSMLNYYNYYYCNYSVYSL